DGARAAAALVDRPDDQGLAAARVAGGEDAGRRRRELGCVDVAAGIAGDAERVEESGLGPDEAHREPHELSGRRLARGRHPLSMQSAPVSPPPMTITCRPVAEIAGSAVPATARLRPYRYSIAKCTPPSSRPGTGRSRGTREPVARTVASKPASGPSTSVPNRN